MTSPFSRILLATEGTEFDVGAERVAIALAADCGVPLSAVLPMVSNPEYQALAPKLEEKAEAEAAAKLDRLRQTAGDIELHGTIRRGENPSHEIVNAAREMEAELLVLRRRGKRSFLANILLGEMVHTVIGNTQSDVLTVPRAAQLWSKGILLATDGSPNSVRATSVAASLAVHCNLPLTVVSVAESKTASAVDEDSAETKIERALTVARLVGAQVDGRVIPGDKPYKAILAEVEETGADLIVIGRRGLNRVKRILVGSTSERVAGSASCPVLIVQSQE